MQSYDSDLDLEDDFDVEIKKIQKTPDYEEFMINPFAFSKSRLITHECKTGLFKLPKDISERYSSWKFDNYHYSELMALMYIDYYRNCDEWKDKTVLEKQINSIMETIPHMKSIDHLFAYAYDMNDIKYSYFDTVIESDNSGSVDVTGFGDS